MPPWPVANITEGVARDGHVDLTLRAAENLTDVRLTALAGSIEGHDVTVHWLRPMPPIEHGEARLTFHNPDALDITLNAGRQGSIAVRGGLVRISGLSGSDPLADIDADLSGAVPDVLTLLSNERLQLFDRNAPHFRDPTGHFSCHLSVAHLPLTGGASMSAVGLRATAHATDVHLGTIAAGHDLDNATLDVDVTNEALNLRGDGQFAGISAKFPSSPWTSAPAPPIRSCEHSRYPAPPILINSGLPDWTCAATPAAPLLSRPIWRSAAMPVARPPCGPILLI